MRRRLVLAVVGLVAVIVVVHDLPLWSHLKRVEEDRVKTALERDAFTIAAKAQSLLITDDPTVATTANGTTLATLVADYAAQGTALVVVVNSVGAVQVATDLSISTGTSFLTRPEISTALLGNSTVGVRRSDTLQDDLVYASVPVLTTDGVVGAVRLTYPKQVVDDRVSSRLTGLLLVAAISLLLAFFAALVIATSAVRPLKRLRQRTDSIASGNLAARADVEGPHEIRELAASFNDMAQRIEQMLAEQRGFAADASHQLRTPLTALRLRIEQAQLTLDKIGAKPEDVADDLEAAAGEIERLQRLIEQLLALARTEAIGNLGVVDVTSIVHNRVDMWSSLAEERGVAVTITSDVKVDALALDGALEQILDNYIDNALDYAPSESEITVSVTVKGDDVVVSVRDIGPGMSSTARERAFDRFWRGAESQNRPGGSGLGLSIVAQLAAASGGTVSLLENVPSGLVASVSLRRASAQ